MGSGLQRSRVGRWTVGALAATALTVAGMGPAIAGPPDPQAEAAQAVADLKREIDGLEGALEVAVEGRARRAIMKRIRRIEGLLDLLERTVGQASTPESRAIPPRAMPTLVFHRLMGQLQRAGFTEERLQLLRAAAADNGFTAAQATAVLQAFSFANERLEAARTLVPRLTDPENGFQLYDAFEFDGDRAAMKALIEAQKAITAPRR